MNFGKLNNIYTSPLLTYSNIFINLIHSFLLQNKDNTTLELKPKPTRDEIEIHPQGRQVKKNK